MTVASTGHSGCQRAMCSLRGLMVGLTAVCVVGTAVAICALVLTNSSASVRSLNRMTDASVDRLAGVMVNQSLNQAAIAVTNFFTTNAELCRSTHLFLHELNATTLDDPKVFNALKSFGRRILSSFSEPAYILIVDANGASFVAAVSPYPYFSMMHASVNGSVPEGIGTESLDEGAGEFPYSIDLRLMPEWSQFIALPDGKMEWSQPNVQPEDFYLGPGTCYHDYTGAPRITSSVGLTTAWMNDLLQRLANTSGSVMMLAMRDGSLVATSHGAPYIRNTSVPDPTTANVIIVKVWETPILAVREAAQACLPLTAIDAEHRAVAAKGGLGNSAYTASPKVQGRASLCATQEITDQYGLSLWLVEATPRSYFFSELDKSREEIQARTSRNTRVTIAICAAILVAALAATIAVAIMVTRPLAVIAEAMGRVALDMDFSDVVTRPQDKYRQNPAALTEVQQLQTSFRTMVVSVGSFAKYVPLGVVRGIVAAGKAPELRVEPTTVAVLFLDIRGFTTIAGRLAADAVATVLSLGLGQLSACVTVNHGTIDKYIGDAIMAFWGAPEHLENPALHACRAARAMCTCVRTTLAEQLTDLGLPAIDVRIGINLGTALVGNVGSAERYSYTAIGDVVNCASRLEALNKQFGTRCAVGQAVVDAVPPEEVRFRSLGKIMLVGCETAIGVAELVEHYGRGRGNTPLGKEVTHPLLNRTNEAAENDEDQEWETAMKTFRQRDFLKAATLFGRLPTATFPAAKYFRDRATELSKLPADAWPGYEGQSAK
eukprot:TRINITY_DN4103_c0_g2_i1.p1 TRINITY_DN4103_c0_g2~~TRINITY_DN4103_c0_g2_i1.p1  ORF type:complete len:775 (+),score=82.68 TRINITY_DN4103_c0_g2_i1:34-2358(+)